MPFSIVEGDIAKMDVDAVVNAANEQLAGGSGVCGAIFSGAGWRRMQDACDAVGHCDTGDAVVTPGFGLPARHVVHAVGPVWRGGGHGEEALLRSAYRRALERACEVGARTVAFPLISAGVYGYPQAEALRVATSEIRAFLDARGEGDGGEGDGGEGEGDLDVTLVIYDRAAFAGAVAGFDEVAALVEKGAGTKKAPFAQRLTDGFAGQGMIETNEAPESPPHFANARAQKASKLGKRRINSAPEDATCLLEAPTQARLADQTEEEEDAAPFASPQPLPRFASPAAAAAPAPDEELARRLAHRDASFSAAVLAAIDERGLTDAQVYKRANLSRQVFSRLRRDDYRPSKPTAVALAMALELSPDETDALLRRAGYALGSTSAFDVIVRYYLERGCCDVFAVNEMLFAFDQPLLGSL